MRPILFFISFLLPVYWLFSLFYLYVVECSCKFNSGLHTMYIRHRVAQLSNKPTLRIAQPIIQQLYVAPCLLPLGLTRVLFFLQACIQGAKQTH